MRPPGRTGYFPAMHVPSRQHRSPDARAAPRHHCFPTAPVSLSATPLHPLARWATDAATALGITITGPAEEMRRRDWTLLARIPTTAGPLWAKACARAFAHEGPLLHTLHRLAPGSVPEPLALHRDNGWFLTADGGETLRADPAQRIPPGTGSHPAPARWQSALRTYAQLQQQLSPHITELRATGVPDLPPARLLEVYQHYEHRAPGLTAAITDAAAELDRYGRLTLEHNDLHPGHVFATGTRFFDWGDAVLTHPFLSMRTLHDPNRETYFDAWRTLGPVTPTEIALAERLAPLTALHPWRTLDLTPGSPAAPLAHFVDDLLTQLRNGFER
ncbi:hypothetical protein NRB56_12310 [Nocardia sp. RB56]|uniref:Aminoglycoside phosphotransferase domain-containing protein n=2 Tax=Nocardia aurantia TaxID=2585199 RepID=A0A7K0DLI3_9NOCA|nr:hypothetical protein [Nocardia aurantia]